MNEPLENGQKRNSLPHDPQKLEEEWILNPNASEQTDRVHHVQISPRDHARMYIFLSFS